MALCPKIFLVVCPNCVPNFMLLSSKPQSFHISAALQRDIAERTTRSTIDNSVHVPHILLLNVANMHLHIEVPFYGMRFQIIFRSVNR